MLTNPVVCKHFSYMSVGVFVAVVKRLGSVQTLLNARSIGHLLTLQLETACNVLVSAKH